MFKKNKLFNILGFMLILMFSLSFSMTAFAQTPITTERQQALEEAKEYLTTRKTDVNEFGKEFTTEYLFQTEEDLNAAAAYIVDHGMDDFNQAVDQAIQEAVSNEQPSELVKPRLTNPPTITQTISGNGFHTVKGETSGLASFKTLGTVEYLVELSYQVNVQNGKITGLNRIKFDIPYLSTAGSWGSLSLPFSNTTNSASVTANYVITKTLSVGVGNFEFDVRSETDPDFFALIASLK